MDVEINYLAVVLAALSTMVVGSVWYAPKVFGKAWMKLAKVKAGGDVTAGEMAYTYGMAFALSFITAFVLAHMAVISEAFYGYGFLQSTLVAALWLWLGFTAARLAMHDLFEMRRKKLTLLNVAHEFVTIMVMALIIGAMGV